MKRFLLILVVVLGAWGCAGDALVGACEAACERDQDCNNISDGELAACRALCQLFSDVECTGTSNADVAAQLEECVLQSCSEFDRCGTAILGMCN